MNRYPGSGPARGLIRRIRAGEITDKGRDLVGIVRAGQKRGTCCWCGEPTNPRAGWHEPCVRAYLAARAATSYTGGQDPLIRTREQLEELYAWNARYPARWQENPHRIMCAACGDRGFRETDHVIALAIAREHRRLGDKRWWRAWTLANLQPLCGSCHADKTAVDRVEIARLRRADVAQGTLL